MSMDFSAASLLSSLLVSTLGTGIFLYGKSTTKPLPMIAGGILGLIPFVISAPWLLWTITAALCAFLYASRERV